MRRRLDDDADVVENAVGAVRAGARHVDEVAVGGVGTEGGAETVALKVLGRRAGHDGDAAQSVSAARAHRSDVSAQDAGVGDAVSIGLDPGFDHVPGVNDSDRHTGHRDLNVGRGHQGVLSNQIYELRPVDLQHAVPPSGGVSEPDLGGLVVGKLQPHGRTPSWMAYSVGRTHLDQ